LSTIRGKEYNQRKQVYKYGERDRSKIIQENKKERKERAFPESWNHTIRASWIVSILSSVNFEVD